MNRNLKIITAFILLDIFLSIYYEPLRATRLTSSSFAQLSLMDVYHGKIGSWLFMIGFHARTILMPVAILVMCWDRINLLAKATLLAYAMIGVKDVWDFWVNANHGTLWTDLLIFTTTTAIIYFSIKFLEWLWHRLELYISNSE